MKGGFEILNLGKEVIVVLWIEVCIRVRKESYV